MPGLCLAVFIFMLCSCNSKKNLDSAGWQILDSTKGVSYKITEKGKGELGDLSIKYVGKMNGNNLVRYTATVNQFLLEQSLSPDLAEKKEIKQLSKGTAGFIKINTEKFFQLEYADIVHYRLFFSGTITDKLLKEDSVKLGSLGVFSKIDMLGSEKAMQKYETDNDTTWRQFIRSNPLPASIDLTLKKEFLTNEKYDSIKNILTGLTRASEIQLPYTNGLVGLNGGLNQELVYKFIIF
jgi:hypothetical protein